MKEANCINPKMAAYCKAVRELEDKFHGLEHKPVLQKYNEAVDTLAKVASNRTPVPNGVFTSNLRVPSVHCEEDDYPSPPALQEVMALGEALEPNLEDPTGGSQSLNGWWTKNSRVTAPRPDASRVGPSPSGSPMGIFTSMTRLEYSCTATSQTRGTNFCRTSTQGLAAITPPPGRPTEVLFDRASTGLQRSRTPRTSCEAAKAAGSMPDKCTSRRRCSRPFPSLGILLCGGSTWSDH
jgi:hypothetical protein